jgi:hypothetical protein
MVFAEHSFEIRCLLMAVALLRRWLCEGFPFALAFQAPLGEAFMFFAPTICQFDTLGLRVAYPNPTFSTGLRILEF